MSQFSGKNSKVEVMEARRGKKFLFLMLQKRKKLSYSVERELLELLFTTFRQPEVVYVCLFVFSSAKIYIINYVRKLPCIALARLSRAP